MKLNNIVLLLNNKPQLIIFNRLQLTKQGKKHNPRKIPHSRKIQTGKKNVLLGRSRVLTRKRLVWYLCISRLAIMRLAEI